VTTDAATAAAQRSAAAPSEEPPRALAAIGVFVAGLFAFVATGAALPVLPTYVRARCTRVTWLWGGRRLVRHHLRRVQADRRSPGRPHRTAGGARRRLARAGAGGLMYLLAAACSRWWPRGWWWAWARAPSTRRAPPGRSTSPRGAPRVRTGMFGLAVWGGLSLGPGGGRAAAVERRLQRRLDPHSRAPLIGAAIAVRVPEPMRPKVAVAGVRPPLFRAPRGAPASRWRSPISAMPRSPAS